ncbi:MAG TPA: ATP-binding protein [Thermoanaerobaculia bacterium]|jgi:signal transduction histidine kinase|nr:ATP-binding protein [Thermoanaerobaculia bacterium]
MLAGYAIAVTIVAAAAVGAVIQLRARLERCATANATAERRFAAAVAETATVSRHRGLLLEILNGLGEGLLAVDRGRHVVLANARFTEMFNATIDLVGRPLGEAARAAAVFSAFDDALAGREASARFPLRTGVAERKIEMRAFPLHADDIAAVALFLDVTQIERLEQIRRNFISDFSHEVRTPLAALRSAVESFDLGADHMSVEEDHQLRRIMARQLARLERLVDDLSELSNIESGDISLERIEVDLFGMVRDLCEDFSERAAQKGLRFSVSGKPVRVYADPVRIQQALANLIDNAIKYGGSDDSIDIEVRAEEENAVVAITDHGEGIAPEEKDRIFRRFYRIDQSRSQEVAGTGLGLAITKHLILLHRGSIDVMSTPGEGATFFIRLPRAT